MCKWHSVVDFPRFARHQKFGSSWHDVEAIVFQFEADLHFSVFFFCLDDFSTDKYVVRNLHFNHHHVSVCNAMPIFFFKLLWTGFIVLLSPSMLVLAYRVDPSLFIVWLSIDLFFILAKISIYFDRFFNVDTTVVMADQTREETSPQVCEVLVIVHTLYKVWDKRLWAFVIPFFRVRWLKCQS